MLRNIRHISTSCCAIVALTISLAGQAQTDPSVGIAMMVRGAVTVEHMDGEPDSLEKGDKIFLGDTINTTSKSYVIVGFDDGAKVTVRPDSSLNIDKYSAEASNLKLLKGGLRAITGAFGKHNPASYRVQTPVATLGIRGTEFDVRVCEETECADEAQRISTAGQ